MMNMLELLDGLNVVTQIGSDDSMRVVDVWRVRLSSGEAWLRVERNHRNGAWESEHREISEEMAHSNIQMAIEIEHRALSAKQVSGFMMLNNIKRPPGEWWWLHE